MGSVDFLENTVSKALLQTKLFVFNIFDFKISLCD